MADHTFMIATWQTEIRSDGAYVVEKITDGTGTAVYGPMPEETVSAFIAERKGIFSAFVSRHLDALRD